MYHTILCTLIGVLSVADLDRADRVPEPCQPLQIDQIIRFQTKKTVFFRFGTLSKLYKQNDRFPKRKWHAYCVN